MSGFKIFKQINEWSEPAVPNQKDESREFLSPSGDLLFRVSLQSLTKKYFSSFVFFSLLSRKFPNNFERSGNTSISNEEFLSIVTVDLFHQLLHKAADSLVPQVLSFYFSVLA